jgi:DNA-3-methyladenine glycosylase II
MPRPGAGSRTTPVPEDPAALRVLRDGDPVMAGLIDRYGDPDAVRPRRVGVPADPYGALLRSIVGQQLSTKAAVAIYGRLAARYGDRTPTPRELLETDPEDLRTVGLSHAKVRYLRDLAERVEAGELDLDRISELPDDEVRAQLTQVKGLGPWSVDMFLIFHLGRPDVLPVGDLGIRKAVQVGYGLDELPDAATITTIGDRWRPWRTLASLYLWRSLDTTPV